MKTLFSIALTLVALLPNRALAREFCYHYPVLASREARPGKFLPFDRPACENLTVLKFKDYGTLGDSPTEKELISIRKALVLKDSWFFTMGSAETNCKRAARGLEAWLNASSSTIEKLNATGDVSLPKGSVIISFEELLSGHEYYEYDGSCSSYKSRYVELTSRKDMEARKNLKKKIDLGDLIGSFIRLGEAYEKKKN